MPRSMNVMRPAAPLCAAPKAGFAQNLKPALLSGPALCLGLAAITPAPLRAQTLAPTPAQAPAGASFTLDIPAQPLSRALRALADQSGLQIAYRTSIAAGTQAPALRGTMTADQALSRLLARSGLSFAFSGANTVTILDARTRARASSGDGVVLDPIFLQRAQGVTEGTNSYTTDVVTGSTGLPLTLRETPQSVSVVTNQRIKDQGLATTQQILSYTTGVQATTFETDRDNTWSRGQWVSSYIIDGIVVDAGIGFNSGAGVHSSSATFDHVEVVRGATGLLTGPGDPSAAVRLERKKATATELTGAVEMRYGSWNRFGLGLDIANKLNDSGSLRGRLVVDASSGDSFRDRYHVNRQTVYGTLAWDLDAATTLSFSYEHRSHDPRGSEWSSWPVVYSDGTPTNLPRSFSTAPAWAYWSSEQDMATARIDHKLGGGWTANATFSAVTREYSAENTRFYGRPDPVTGEGMTLYARKAEEFQRQLALDASVSGPVSAFGRDHVLNFGFHGGRDWNRADDYEIVGEQPSMGSMYDWTGDVARPQFYLPEAGEWTIRSTQYSGYGSARISLADPLTAIAGLRYTDWKADTRHFAEFTSYFGLVYDLNDTASIFASHTQIFNPQSYRDRNGSYLSPVQGKSDEAGIKAAWFDNRLNASLSYYRTYQDNVAIADDDQVVPGTGEQAYTGTMGQTARGVELDLSGEIRPGWNLFFGASTMKVTDADGELTNTFLPRHTLKLFTTYNLPVDGGRWTLGGGARWQSGTWNTLYLASGTMRNDQSAYAVVDAMVRYDISEKWSAQLNVNNLFDKVYYHNASVAAVYGEPRNAMLTLVSRF